MSLNPNPCRSGLAGFDTPNLDSSRNDACPLANGATGKYVTRRFEQGLPLDLGNAPDDLYST